MSANLKISKARRSENETLTDISFEAKRHWKYPDEYYNIWEEELTITKEYITQNIVYKAETGTEIIGFYSIVENPKDFYVGEVFIPQGFWLEHIFIRPKYHYNGIGTQLIEHAKLVARQNQIKKLLIFVDPKAKGFYDKIGAKHLRDSKSSIKDRMIPLYEMAV